MVATEPLPLETWEQLGLAERQTFADDRYLVIYGQRTADDRIAFGGRGAPYGYGSRIDASIETDSKTHHLVEETLRELLPSLGEVEITHRWGGVLGVPRRIDDRVLQRARGHTGRVGPQSDARDQRRRSDSGRAR